MSEPSWSGPAIRNRSRTSWSQSARQIGGEALLGVEEPVFRYSGPVRSEYLRIARQTVATFNYGASLADLGISEERAESLAEPGPDHRNFSQAPAGRGAEKPRDPGQQARGPGTVPDVGRRDREERPRGRCRRPDPGPVLDRRCRSLDGGNGCQHRQGNEGTPGAAGPAGHGVRRQDPLPPGSDSDRSRPSIRGPAAPCRTGEVSALP